MAGPTLTDKTNVRLTVAGLIALLIGAVGVHPWAVAQVRAVVREENRVLTAEAELARQREFASLRAEVRELTGEVKSLKALVIRLAGKRGE